MDVYLCLRLTSWCRRAKTDREELEEEEEEEEMVKAEEEVEEPEEKKEPCGEPSREALSSTPQGSDIPSAELAAPEPQFRQLVAHSAEAVERSLQTVQPAVSAGASLWQLRSPSAVRATLPSGRPGAEEGAVDAVDAWTPVVARDGVRRRDDKSSLVQAWMANMLPDLPSPPSALGDSSPETMDVRFGNENEAPLNNPVVAAKLGDGKEDDPISSTVAMSQVSWHHRALEALEASSESDEPPVGRRESLASAGVPSDELRASEDLTSYLPRSHMAEATVNVHLE